MPASAWAPVCPGPLAREDACAEEPAGINGYTSFDAPYSLQGGEDSVSYGDGAGLQSWASQPSPADLGPWASPGEPYRVGSTSTRGGSSPSNPLPSFSAPSRTSPPSARPSAAAPAAPAASGAPLCMEVGATVRIKGLRSKPKLNGQEGSLVDCDGAGRWSVLLGDGDVCKLQEKFLELRAPPAPPPPARERSPSPAAANPDPELSDYFVPSADAEIEYPERSGYSATEPQEQRRFQPARVPPETLRSPAASRVAAVDSPGPEDCDLGITKVAARPSGTGRSKISWAKPNLSMFDQPSSTEAATDLETREPQRTASSSSKAPGSAKASAPKAKAKTKEARLDDHLAALQAMMAQEEAKQERLLRQSEAAAVPGIDQLLANLDKAQESEHGGATRSSSSRGSASAMKMPSSAPRALNPDEAAVPDLGQLLAEIDGHGEADQNAPSIDAVLALIDKDEEDDSARGAFLMLGSGVEPEPAKPMDPLAKMLRLTGSSVNPMDLLPTRYGTPSTEERRPEIPFVSRRATWRRDEPRAPAPSVALALEDSLVGEGPLFGAGGER